jgi:hypothetical protein
MIDDDAAFPVKWLDGKEYVRIDPQNGQPQLIRIEPMMSDDGHLIPHSVTVYIDNDAPVIMDRMAAEALVESSGCTPLEVTAQWKHRRVH